MAFHLGKLKRGFDEGTLNEECVYIAGEMHFVVDLSDKRTLTMKGEAGVKFSDNVSDDVDMIMIVLPRGGSKAHLEALLIMFQNDRSSRTIEGLPDSVRGVCYSSGGKG